MSLRDISDITRLGVVKKIIEVIDYFMSNDIDASRVKGQLDISNIPPAGLDNVIKVDTVTDMLALTVDDVQNGDTVMIIGVTPPVQYQVVDDTKLGTMDAFQEYAAGTATKALADINGNNIHTTYGKLAGNNTWTGNNYWNGSAIFNANLTIRGSATTPGDVSTYLWLGTQPKGSKQTPSIYRNKIGDLVMYAADYRPCYLRSGIQTSFASVYNSDGTVEFSSLNNTPWGKYTNANGLELTVHKTPTANNDVPNKKYVDDSVASAGGGDVLAAGNNSFTGANTFQNLVTMVGGVVFTSGTTTLAWKNATQIVATINASTYTGNSATATKLATARTITANLASSTAGSFNGSANITVGVTGTLPIANGGTGATTAAAARTALGCAPAYTYSTTDLTAGSSALTTGTLYIVYE